MLLGQPIPFFSASQLGISIVVISLSSVSPIVICDFGSQQFPSIKIAFSVSRVIFASSLCIFSLSLSDYSIYYLYIHVKSQSDNNLTVYRRLARCIYFSV